jgi:predicted transcriptional regulator
MKRCVVGIRHPDQFEARPTGKDAPTVWFASMASLAAVLSEDNRALLRVIREAKPRSLTELAELTGRKLPNLSRTIKTMASHGLVDLIRDKGEVRPMVRATAFTVLLD